MAYLKKKTIKKHIYYYLCRDIEGKQKCKYIGSREKLIAYKKKLIRESNIKLIKSIDKHLDKALIDNLS